MISRKTWWIVGAACVVVFAGSLVAQMAFDAWRLTTGPSSWYLLITMHSGVYVTRRSPPVRPRLVSGPYRDQATCERERDAADLYCRQMLDADAAKMRR